MQGFYERKEYGLWGLRDTDQHEAYWEQQVEWGASLHPQLSSERMNADGVRLQAWWCQNFRFLPPAQNHPLVHRITHQCQMDDHADQLWDRQAWRYAVLSALAVGNGLTACILPEDPATVPGYAEFLARWLAWARATRMKQLADEKYPKAEKIVIMMDNFNTQSPASFYETVEPEEALRLSNRFEFHYTPKHGSWLNMAEIELGVLIRQCLNRRIADKATLETEVNAWQNDRYAKVVKVDWRF